jgi:hypothetical protein
MRFIKWEEDVKDRFALDSHSIKNLRNTPFKISPPWEVKVLVDQHAGTILERA